MRDYEITKLKFINSPPLGLPWLRCRVRRSGATVLAQRGSLLAGAVDPAATRRLFRPAKRLPASILQPPLPLRVSTKLRHSPAGDHLPHAETERIPPASLLPRFPPPCSRRSGKLPDQRAQRRPACPQ